MRWHALLGTLIVAMTWATAASAQKPAADSFAQLRNTNRLRPGDDVSITRDDGTRTSGTVKSISPAGLSLNVGQHIVDLSEDGVRKVVRRDPVSNGIVMGLAVGVGTMLVANRSICGDDPECGAIVNVYIGLPAVGIGALAGALIDRSRTETVFQSRTSALSRLTAAPLVSRRQKGLVLSLTW